MSIRVISDAEGFDQLASEWRDLLADSPGDRWFRAHLWQRAWWEVYGGGRRLTLLAVRNAAGQLVGIAPLQRRRVRYRGLIAYRRLEFLASGENEADEIDSDYLDFILRDGWERPVLRRIVRHLMSAQGGVWDEMCLERIPAESATPNILRELAPEFGLRLMETRRFTGVVVSLPSTRDELLTRLGSQRRIDYRRGLRLLAREGSVQFRWSRTAEEFVELWPEFVALHQKRWQSRDRAGCFASPLFAAFHRRVGAAAAGRGQARIAQLSVNQSPVAACYVFLSDGVAYHYQSGLDLRFGARSSPGTTLIGQCLDAAIDEGLRTWDFLRGPQRYQQFWSPELRGQTSWRLGRCGARETLRQLLESIRARHRRGRSSADHGAGSRAPSDREARPLR